MINWYIISSYMKQFDNFPGTNSGTRNKMMCSYFPLVVAALHHLDSLVKLHALPYCMGVLTAIPGPGNVYMKDLCLLVLMDWVVIQQFLAIHPNRTQPTASGSTVFPVLFKSVSLVIYLVVLIFVEREVSFPLLEFNFSKCIQEIWYNSQKKNLYIETKLLLE